MSGGKFDYAQYRIEDIANSIEDYIYGHEVDDDELEEYTQYNFTDEDEVAYVKKHHHTIPNPYGYDKSTIKEMKKGLDILRKAYIYAQRIDWLLSGDDGEDRFHERLKEELDELKKQ